MKTEMNDLKNKWKDAERTLESNPHVIEQLIARAKAKKKSSLYFHYGNIAVLALTLIVIVIFFYFIFPFQDRLSKSGVALMVVGLAVRILIEIFSSIKSQKIDLSNTALKATVDTEEFYSFRRKIHGPVTLIIVGIYTIGFYMLTPEYSRHFDLLSLILIDVSYIVGAVFLIWQIGKGIKKEMKQLSEIIELRKEIAEKD